MCMHVRLHSPWSLTTFGIQADRAVAWPTRAMLAQHPSKPSMTYDKMLEVAVKPQPLVIHML